VRVWHNEKSVEASLAIVTNKPHSYEQAIFMFKHPKKFSLNSRVQLLTVLPISQELRLIPRKRGFAIRWLDYSETQIEVSTPDSTMLNKISGFLSEFVNYQGEPFHSGSNIFKWLWHYQSIPVKAQILKFNTEKIFSEKREINFMPQHYGQKLMNAFVNQQLLERKHKFTETLEVRVMVGTWNVGGTAPRDDLERWLRCQGSIYQSPEDPPDIILLCFQEICQLSPKNILGDESRKRDWVQFVVREVNRVFESQFTLVAERDLVGLLSVVFVKNQLKNHLKLISSVNVKLGFKGYTGNKGGILSRFELFDTSFCVVNCHLAPFRNQTKLRNSQIQSLVEQARFMLDQHKVNIFEHDIVFWTGDLNYRLEGLSTQDILNKIQSCDYSYLLQYDQLRQEKKNNNILQGFKEATIAFPPSYKFSKESETEYSVGKRDPAWCDRVLSRGELNILRYGSCEFNTQSDHKPVFGYFVVPVKKFNFPEFNRVKAEIHREIDEVHHKSIPKLKLSENFLEFQNLVYKEKQSLSLVLTNTGNTETVFSSQLKENKTWLFYEPKSGSVPVGGQVNLKVEVFFAEAEARLANSNSKYTTAIIVISLKGGSDHFIEVTCNFKSNFGSTCQDLVLIDPPIADLPRHIKTYSDYHGTPHPIPYALHNLTQFIVEKGCTRQGLFQTPSGHEEILLVKKALDYSSKLPENLNIHSVCGVLLEFLKSLEKPMLSPGIVEEGCSIYSSSGNYQRAKEFVFNNLDIVSQRCFLFITQFLKFILDYKSRNSLEQEVLAKAFFEPLTHTEELTKKELKTSQKLEFFTLLLFS